MREFCHQTYLFEVHCHFVLLDGWIEVQLLALILSVCHEMI